MIVSLLSRNIRCVSYLKKKKRITAGKLSIWTLEVPAERSCCHEFIKILTVGTAIKLSDIKIIAQHEKKVLKTQQKQK